MDRTLQEHIGLLQRRLEQLHEPSMNDKLTQGQRNRVEGEIRAALLALDYYHKAIDLEKQVRAR